MLGKTNAAMLQIIYYASLDKLRLFQAFGHQYNRPFQVKFNVTYSNLLRCSVFTKKKLDQNFNKSVTPMCWALTPVLFKNAYVVCKDVEREDFHSKGNEDLMISEQSVL